MILNGDAGSRCLCVVYKYIDTSELLNSRFDNTLCGGFVVFSGGDFGGNGQNPYSVILFKLFLCLRELCLVSSGDYEVCALFCVCGRDPVTYRTAPSVRQYGIAASCDYCGFYS